MKIWLGAIAAMSCVANAASASVMNGGFEDGTFTEWKTLGTASVESTWAGLAPTEGNCHALLQTAGSFALGAFELETYLDLDTGTFDKIAQMGDGTGTATEGSVITREFTVEAGDTLSFDWNFLTNEGADDSPARDLSFIMIGDESPTWLAHATDAVVESATSFASETGYQSFSHTFSEAGTFEIILGVIDVDGSDGDSALFIDAFDFTSILIPLPTADGWDLRGWQESPPCDRRRSTTLGVDAVRAPGPVTSVRCVPPTRLLLPGPTATSSQSSEQDRRATCDDCRRAHTSCVRLRSTRRRCCRAMTCRVSCAP